MKRAYIVVGLGFGDEGKGLVAEHLCKTSKNPIVIRFNGGQQAGHTVYLSNGVRHNYSSFGVGTHLNIPTYWSKYCTFSPAYFCEEYKELNQHSIYYLHLDCPVTTHYDVLYNRLSERSRKNKIGSSGMGHSSTTTRHYDDKIIFTVRDLNMPAVKEKLSQIRDYYRTKFAALDIGFDEFDHENEDELFLKFHKQLMNLISEGEIIIDDDFTHYLSKFDAYIFEGAQGILLDKEFGTSPYITQSYTTSRNAIDIISDELDKGNILKEVYYVTRVYQNRHGFGPFDEVSHNLITNVDLEELFPTNEFQGKFKVGYLNADLIDYAIKCDRKYSADCDTNIVFTCVDHLNGGQVQIISKGKVLLVNPSDIPRYIHQHFKSVKYSFSPYGDKLTDGCH